MTFRGLLGYTRRCATAVGLSRREANAIFCRVAQKVAEHVPAKSFGGFSQTGQMTEETSELQRVVHDEIERSVERSLRKRRRLTQGGGEKDKHLEPAKPRLAGSSPVHPTI